MRARCYVYIRLRDFVAEIDASAKSGGTRSEAGKCNATTVRF